MQVDELIAKLREEADDLGVQRANTRLHLMYLDADWQRVMTQLDALEGAANRYGIEVGVDDPIPVGSGAWPAPWSKLNRQEAALHVLQQHGQPLHLSEIVERLQTTERTGDTMPLISAALAALKRKGLVESVKRGVWRLPQQPEQRTVHALQEGFGLSGFAVGEVRGPEDEETG